MSKRLFYTNPYDTKFSSAITEVLVKKFENKNRTALVLQETLFYPTSGGQPNDLGTINNIKVVDVVEEKHKIVHILESEVAWQVNDVVQGEIEWERRLDHMQQHHG